MDIKDAISTEDKVDVSVKSDNVQMEIKEMTDTELKLELAANSVVLHHKTGVEKLRSTLKEVRLGNYIAPVTGEIKPKVLSDSGVKTSTPIKTKVGPTDAAKKAAAEGKKLTKQQRAMRLQRIVVSPNDPLMSAYTGLIFTVGSSSVNNGRMVKKFVPFNNDEGWHVPQIIIDQIDAAQMQKFKLVKMPGGEKVMQPYLTKKFNVQILPPLTNTEMKKLAASQQAKGGIST